MGEKETWDDAKKAEEKGTLDERLQEDPTGRVRGSKSNTSERVEDDDDMARATSVKGSKSNSSERLAAGGADGPGTPAEASNLNLSKSNVNRLSGDPSGLAEATMDTSHVNPDQSQLVGHEATHAVQQSGGAPNRPNLRMAQGDESEIAIDEEGVQRYAGGQFSGGGRTGFRGPEEGAEGTSGGRSSADA